MTTRKTGVLVLITTFMLGLSSVSAHKNITNLALGFSANPVTDGTSVSITGTLTYTGTTTPGSGTDHGTVPSAGTPVVGADVRIEQLQLAGVGVACGTPFASYVQIASGTTNGSGQYSTTFDTTGLGGSTIGFRAHHPAEGGTHGTDQAQSPCDGLIINASCDGVTVAATLASGPGAPPPSCCPNGGWTFRISVKNCTGVNLTNVKVQGGSNGWGTFASATPSTGSCSIRFNNRSEVITCTMNIANGATETIDVNVSGCIPPSAPDGQVRYLSGAWSAAYNSGGPQKSNYSGRVSITVDSTMSCP